MANHAQGTTVPTVSTFNFHGDTLAIVEHNSQPFVAMRGVIEAMGLAWQSQLAKLKSNPRFCVTEIVTQAPGDKQARSMIFMPLRKLSGWLMSIHPNKVKPELREKVIAYQNECDDALWAYWTDGVAKRDTLSGRAYSVNPNDTLTAAQAEQLRLMVREACTSLPKHLQAGFTIKAWSKLKSHFGVSYRNIPQREYQEAVSLVARHVSEWKLLDAPTKEETMEPTPGDLTNPAYYRDCKEQLYKFIDRVAPNAKWPDDEATSQKIADGYLADLLTSRRWIASFDHRGQLQLSPIPFDAMMVTESALPECIEDPTITSADTVLSVLEACAARLQRRQERKS